MNSLKRLQTIMRNMLGTLALKFIIVVAVTTLGSGGCITARTFQRISDPGIEEDAVILHERWLLHEGKLTSAVTFSVCRISCESVFCEFVLSGELSHISASVLFPEDVWIVHSSVRFRYQDGGQWYEKFRDYPPKMMEILEEEFTLTGLPKHIPYGIGSGYRLMRKLVKNRLDEPALGDHLENRFDSVDVVFTEKKGVDVFSIRIPLEKLQPRRRYDVRFIAQYYDGQARFVDGALHFELE